jgi:Tol biopolymer transport system component
MSRTPVLLLLGLTLATGAIRCIAADRVVFWHFAPTEATLYLSNADGTGERPLTQPCSINYNPAWAQSSLGMTEVTT